MREQGSYDVRELSADDIAKHDYSLRTRGFSLLEGVVDLQECLSMKESMLAATNEFQPVDGVERSFLDRYQIHDLLNKDLRFARLLEDPRLQNLLASFLGPFWTMYAATSSAVPPHGKNYANRIHNDTARFSRDYIFNIGVIWTLDEYTEKNGALRVLPASHHLEAAPSEEYFEENAQPVLCPPGTLIFFHAGLYHRAGENRTDNWRCSMTMNACRSFMKPRMDWTKFIDSEIVGVLNNQAKRILGFDSRVPASLEEFFLPENERLYKTGQG